MIGTQTAIEELASTLRAGSARPLDEATIEHVRHCVFDSLCSAHVSFHHANLDRRSLDGAGSDVAALVAAARASEMDDIHVASCITAGSVAVPCGIMLGAELHASDEAVIAAIVDGYEVMVRLGLAIDGAVRIYEGIWPSMLAAPMGAAAVASALFGLDIGGTADALALAAARSTAAVWFADEPSGRWVQFGLAAAEGIRAARLAAAGFRGDRHFLEHSLPRSIRVDLDLARLLGAEAERAIDQIDLKPFRTARQILSAAEAALELGRQVEPGRVARIEVAVPAQCKAMVDRPDPTGPLACASAQYQVALALVRPHALYSSDPPDLADPALRSMMALVEVQASDRLTTAYPACWGGAVTIHDDAGQRSAEVLVPIGASSRPLGWAELSDKYARLGMPADAHSALLRSARSLAASRDRVSAPQLAALAAQPGRSAAT